MEHLKSKNVVMRYAPQGWQVLTGGNWIEDNPAYGLVVHPPVGKWLLAIGESMFGYTPMGWRVMSALAGIAIVVMIYFAVLVRGLWRLVDEEDLFTVLAGAGLLCQFSAQAFINILVNLQLFPSKGMTLPFISYGGSSALAMAICVGMMLSLTREHAGLREAV